jgi:hypothetical protein
MKSSLALLQDSALNLLVLIKMRCEAGILIGVIEAQIRLLGQIGQIVQGDINAAHFSVTGCPTSHSTGRADSILFMLERRGVACVPFAPRR